MIKVSTAIQEIISHNPLLELGLSQQILNLTQVAKYIQPLVQTRLKKSIQTQAIVMALSRLQKKLSLQTKVAPLLIESLSQRSNLFECTYTKSPALLNQVNRFHLFCQQEHSFCSIIESNTEVTVISEMLLRDRLQQEVLIEPSASVDSIVAIDIKFHRQYLNLPGMFYFVIQQITLQNINILELTSTGSEFLIFVAAKDAKLAFQTLSDLFQAQHGA